MAIHALCFSIQRTRFASCLYDTSMPYMSIQYIVCGVGVADALCGAGYEEFKRGECINGCRATKEW